MNVTEQPLHLTEWRALGAADPRVILIHGGAQGTSSAGQRHFAGQVRLGTQGWHVIVPDRPGHGRSPARGVPDDAEIEALWVGKLMQGGAHIVGHSFGGCVALESAVQNLGNLRSLTLIEPALQNIRSSDPAIETWRRIIHEAYEGKTGIEIAIGFGRDAGIPRELLQGGPGESLTQEEAMAELQRLGDGLMALRLPSEARIMSNLAAIKQAGVPLLVVSGGWNPGIDAVAQAAAAEGGGKYVQIASPHHFPQLVGDGFNEALVELMSRAKR